MNRIPEEQKLKFLKSIYNYQMKNKENYEYSLMISLTNACNLNCTNCQTFCGLSNRASFTTLDDIKKYLPHIKNKLKQCTSIFLFGGEPLLNPQIKEIALYIRELYPTMDITIFTNGLLLTNWNDTDLKMIKDLNIKFLITLYPTEKSIQNTQFYEEKLKKMNIKLDIHGNRPFFTKSSFNPKGTNNQLNRYFTCFHSQIPIAFYLHKNKLFKCGVCPNYETLGLPQDRSDYLLVDEMTEDDIKEYLSRPLEACKYCSFQDLDENNEIDLYGSDELMIWHTQKDLQSNYSNSLLDLYLNNYDYYYKCCHDCENLINVLNNKYFLSKQDKNNYRVDIFSVCNIRFFNGIGDFYIPFENSETQLFFIEEFKNQLKSQKEFKEMNFYFVSIDKNNFAKRKVYRNFIPFSCDIEGNYYFLEAKDNNGYETFLKNSYLKNKKTLNINSELINNMKKNSKYLKFLLEEK